MKRLAIVCAIAGIALLGAALASANPTCNIVYFPPADGLFWPNVSSNGTIINTMQFNQQATNWAGFAVVNFTGNDYDLFSYYDCNGNSLYASSTYGSARTDFVVGDYNNDPTGVHDVEVRCYSGGCGSTGTYGVGTWRTGGLMNVDFPPVTLDFTNSQTYSPDMIMHVWDVYLNAGTTYYFQFSSTLGNNAKLCLMRNPNPGGGTYWAGRSAAAFETSGCTTYTPNVTGYYGLVAVNDTWALGKTTVGVFTTPQCACGDSIVPRTPYVASPAPGIAYTWAQHRYASWSVVGERPQAGSDWDLQVGVGGDGGSLACPQSLLATSTFGGSVADFVAVDFNHVPFNQYVPFAIQPFRFSGGGSATYEADYFDLVNQGPIIQIDGAQVAEQWNASTVVECWDTFLDSTQTYTFQFAGSANMRAFLFRNPGSGLYAAGRSSAVAQSNTTFNYTASTTGWYGVIVAKDDDQTGYFALRIGTCLSADTLTANQPTFVGPAYAYLAITPQAGAWQAVGTRRLGGIDWDLTAYGTGSAPWPDCFSPVLAGSYSSSVPDFIVGDFHANPPGPYAFMAHQYTSGPVGLPTVEWTGPATPITVNAPTILASPPQNEVLRVYEANLVGGFTYNIGYVPNSNRPLLVFGNPSPGTPYWAPRGQALLTTTSTTTFTPPASGVYALVVANDAGDTTTFQLRIGTNPTGVGDPPPSFVTAFAGARPNPGRADVALEYSLATPAHVQLELVDVTGRRVWQSDEGARNAGTWSARLARAGPGGRIPSGLYFAHFVVDGRRVETRKVTLLD